MVAPAAAAVWLGLGHRAGALQLTGWIPVLGEFRYAEKLMAPVTLCAAVLCATATRGGT